MHSAGAKAGSRGFTIPQRPHCCPANAVPAYQRAQIIGVASLCHAAISPAEPPQSSLPGLHRKPAQAGGRASRLMRLQGNASASVVPSGSSNSNSGPPNTEAHATTSGQQHASITPITVSSGVQLRPFHVLLYALIFISATFFATLTLQYTAEMDFRAAVNTVLRSVTKSIAFKQLVVIAGVVTMLRYGLKTFVQFLSKFSPTPVQWDKTKLYYVLREVYQPLELLLMISAICTVADSFIPSLIPVPKATVSQAVKSTLSISFILGAASVVFNLKSRFCKEQAWQSEMKGDVTSQRRWEAYDKLATFVVYAVTFTLGVQAIGLEVTSVLAIGGIGGLAIGLAGREICENLLNGFLIMSTQPFEVGDEVSFTHSSKNVEGLVMDIGWYRTLIRSFEREVWVVPNAVFSKHVVLNVSKKQREFRFLETISLRVQDVRKVKAIVESIRQVVKQEPRVINKLHRRIYMTKITMEDVQLYVSFYLEANNRDQYLGIKQELLLQFVDIIERHGAELAVPRRVIGMDPEASEVFSSSLGPAMGVLAAAQGGSTARGRSLSDTSAINAEATTCVPPLSVGSASSISSNPGSSKGEAASTPSSPTMVFAGPGGMPTTTVSIPSADSPMQQVEQGATWLLKQLARTLFE